MKGVCITRSHVGCCRYRRKGTKVQREVLTCVTRFVCLVLVFCNMDLGNEKPRK